jgi:hypothetical protein
MAENIRLPRKRPSGICKLCLLEKTLCESHLMPTGLYRFCRRPDCDPVLITSKVMMPTSRQTKHRLLCEDCEMLLNRNGEDWVLPTLATTEGGFPFYSLLQKQSPLFDEPGATAYAVSSNPEIHREALVHFALGIFWKASVHSWKQGSISPRIDLGLQGEYFRRFLRGQAGFPQNMALLLEVSPPPVGAICFTHPVSRRTKPEMFFFYVPGMMFTLWRGDLTEEQRLTCLISNRQGPVVSVDTTPRVMQLLKENSDTARKTEHMHEIIRKREHDGRRRFKL